MKRNIRNIFSIILLIVFMTVLFRINVYAIDDENEPSISITDPIELYQEQYGGGTPFKLNRKVEFSIILENIPNSEKENVNITIENENIAKITDIDLCNWEGGFGGGEIRATTNLIGIGNTTITATINYKGKTYTDNYSFTVVQVDDDVYFSIPNRNPSKGESIIIPVDMNCINSFSAGNFVITYDSSVLEYEPYLDSNGNVVYSKNYGETLFEENEEGQLERIAHIAINSSTPGTIKIAYMSENSVAGKTGGFLKLRFKVKDDAGYTISTISISATTLKDENGNDLNAFYEDGFIKILSGITMNNNAVEMKVGNENKLYIISSGLVFDKVEWTSSNTNVVSVAPKDIDSRRATINAVSVGTATITATVGGVSATCSVTVTETEEEYSISITNPAWTLLPVSQIRTLSAVFNPTTASENKTITWTSSNTNVATINSSTGEITAKAEGTTTITASDENKSATYTLTVSGMLGDIDNDKIITSYDAYRALVLDTNIRTGASVNENEIVILDFNKDGEIIARDAFLILEYSVGLSN